MTIILRCVATEKGRLHFAEAKLPIAEADRIKHRIYGLCADHPVSVRFIRYRFEDLYRVDISTQLHEMLTDGLVETANVLLLPFHNPY